MSKLTTFIALELIKFFLFETSSPIKVKNISSSEDDGEEPSSSYSE